MFRPRSPSPARPSSHRGPCLTATDTDSSTDANAVRQTDARALLTDSVLLPLIEPARQASYNPASRQLSYPSGRVANLLMIGYCSYDPSEGVYICRPAR